MSLILTPEDLAFRFRSDVDDPLRGPASAPDNDCLWKIVDVKYYMGVAVNRVSRKGEQLFNTFSLVIKNGDPLVRLPKTNYYIADIRRAYVCDIRRELKETNIEDLRNYHRDYGEIIGSGGWEERKGYPVWFIRNYIPGALRIVPIPVIENPIYNGQFNLELTAALFTVPIDGMPLPFEDPEDVELVLLWMKKMAFSKNDADTYDQDKALKFENEFKERILERNSEARRIRRAPTRTIFQW